MAFFIKNLEISDNMFKHEFSSAAKDSLAANVDFTLLKEGYRLVEGYKAFGEYEKGNRTVRILLGAFAKYFKFTVNLEEKADHHFELIVVGTNAGISGGLISNGQLKTELQRLAKVFTTL